MLVQRDPRNDLQGTWASHLALPKEEHKESHVLRLGWGDWVIPSQHHLTSPLSLARILLIQPGPGRSFPV